MWPLMLPNCVSFRYKRGLRQHGVQHPNFKDPEINPKRGSDSPKGK